jgi:CRP/FNR family cyclic AMP-dependent transcriptional regulator
MTGLHEVVELAEIARRCEVTAGDVVFEVGDPVDAVHIVVSGVLLVRSVSIDGDQAVVDVRGRGDLLDDTALLDGRPALHFDGATALTGVRLLRVPLHAFDDLRDRSATVGAALVGQLTDQVRRLSTSLVDLLGRTGRARAARRLLAIADALERSGMASTPLVVTQKDLADFVGTTRSTLNAHLKEFEGAGAIASSRGRLTITDVDALDRFA